MKKITVVLAVAALTALFSIAHSQRGTHVFTLNAPSIGGANGEVILTGGVNFDPQSGSVRGGGSFHCTRDIIQGPLAGCRAGEGVRWEAVEVLSSTGFKCGGSPGEPAKTAVTDDDTVVLQADFYRQGDGVNASFTAKLFISAGDEDPAQPGVQNVWIQQVGCGEANVNFQ